MTPISLKLSIRLGRTTLLSPNEPVRSLAKTDMPNPCPAAMVVVQQIGKGLQHGCHLPRKALGLPHASRAFCEYRSSLLLSPFWSATGARDFSMYVQMMN